MNNPLEKLHREAESIRMTHAEKTAMWNSIQERMRREARPMRPVKSTYMWVSWRATTAFAVIMVMVIGTGTTYAAEGALPGTPLYAIKVGVNEPVREALAFSNEAKVQFHTEVAETRLEEAEALAAEGRLSGEVSTTLAADLSEHVEKAELIVRKIEETDPGMALEVTVQLDSSLSAHGEVLAHLGEKSEDESTRENSIALAQNAFRAEKYGYGGGAVTMALTVQGEGVPAELVSDLPIGGAGDVSTSSTATTAEPMLMATNAAPENARMQKSAEEDNKINESLARRAEDKLKDARLKFNAVQKSLSTTTAAAVEARIDAIELQIEEGLYNDALRGAIELSTFLSASRKFNKGMLDSLLRKYHIEVNVGEVRGEMDVKFEQEEKSWNNNRDEDENEDEDTEEEDPKKIEETGGIKIEAEHQT